MTILNLTSLLPKEDNQYNHSEPFTQAVCQQAALTAGVACLRGRLLWAFLARAKNSLPGQKLPLETLVSSWKSIRFGREQVV